MGGRIGYSAATGVMVIVLSWFGIIALMLALIPVVAISPILLYIGMLIGAQAFQESPKSHAPAVVLALIAASRGVGQAADRQFARRGGNQCGRRRARQARRRSACSITALSHGRRRHPRRPGARRDRRRSSSTSDSRRPPASRLAGAVLTFFGFMHGEAIGFAMTPTVALAYAMVAAFFFALSKMPAEAEAPSFASQPKAVPAE